MHIAVRPSPFSLNRAMALGVLVAGMAASSASQAADATATASGTVVQPIAITAAENLNFGSFAPGAGGTITVSTSGARTATGAIAVGTDAAAARFDITGTASATYSITHGGTALLTNTTGAGETMALAKFSDLTGGNATSGNVTSGTLDALGAQSVFVGGTLTVAANQAPGLYTGSVIATVEYN